MTIEKTTKEVKLFALKIAAIKFCKENHNWKITENIELKLR